MYYMNKKMVTLLKMIILSLGLIAITVGVTKDKNKTGTTTEVTNYGFAMGTSISINIYPGSSQVDVDELTKDINHEIKELDEQLISWRTEGSQLNLLNENYKISENYEISQELYTVLRQSLAICKDSEGALDITIRPLAALWNIEGDSDSEFVPPSDKDIDIALEKVDYKNIELFSDSDAVYYSNIASEGMIIDLGATGKGYALDKTKAVLENANVDGALITVGGSVLVYGKKPSGESWRIGVRDPMEPNDTSAMMGYIEFSPGTVTCISTSGGYEKFKTYGGKDYHHILDSKTGYPAESDVLSVTIVCDNGLVSDGLSTACYILGYEKSLPLLEKYNAEAVFVDLEGNIIVTEGLKGKWID